MSLAKRPPRWTGFRSIVCAVDFSDHSRLGLQYAEAVALRGRASLHVVYAEDPLLVAAAAAALHDRQIARRSGVELKAFVEKTLTKAPKQQLQVTTRVAVGAPDDVILKAASRARADLIVLGTHGLTGADRLIMGSTTLAVLQRTKVPVLAVPRRLEGPPPSASWPGRQIVAPVELDAGAPAEVNTAARIAKWFDASLLLLHVVSTIAPPQWFEGNLEALEQTRTARAQQQIDRLAAAARRRVPTETRVIQGKVADEIAAFGTTAGTQLLIAALRDRAGWFGAKRGAISYHALSHGKTPVLAYPPRWRAR